MSVTTDIQDDIAIIRFDDGNKNVINHELLDDLEMPSIKPSAATPKYLFCKDARVRFARDTTFQSWLAMIPRQPRG